jgi:hypothetical protein
VLETGVDHGEKQRTMVLAAERLGGGGQVPLAGSDETRWPKAASNPHEGELVPEAGVEPSRGYPQGILSQLIFSIDPNSVHASPCCTAQKLLIQSCFANSRYMVVDADNVGCCEKMSHECPMD